MGLGSLSLPAIATGKFGFPRPLCASIMVDAVSSWFSARPTSRLKRVALTNFDDVTKDAILTGEYEPKINTRTESDTPGLRPG